MARSKRSRLSSFTPGAAVMSMLWSLLRVFLLLLLSGMPASAHTTLKVGIAPGGMDSVSLATRWVPFLRQLEASSELTLHFSTAPDLLAFHQRLGNGDYDLIVTDSYLYTIFNQKHALQFMAELGPREKDSDLVLVCHPDIQRIEQLNGALLAVRKGEANSNLQLLDEFLTGNGVTVLRDGVSSNEKLLSSVEEKIHLAGLVPLDIAREQGPSLNILWQIQSQHHYVMSTPPLLDRRTQKQVSEVLDKLLTEGQTAPSAEISVLSVRKTEK